ncbi:MAG: hypothetical protein COB14_04870 [Alphaproteobacteria bacterium]|nr:MAG: hypothetical protein COB14_04870 [Alphaproteobacteria bacterium]
MAYSSSDTENLTQDVQKLLSEQREDVVGTYPADFLYYPMKAEDGNPLIVKVDDAHYSAWMSRDAAGEPFSDVTLMTENQVNEIYAQIPGGPSGKMNVGESVYVNPALGNREVAGDSFTNVTFNVETGDIIDAAQAAAETARAERISGRSRSTETDTSTSSKYDTATVPNSIIVDGNVSLGDLTQKLEGYQLISHIDSEAMEETSKRAATGFLIDEIAVSIGRLLVTQGGAIEASMAIENTSVLSAASNIGLETKLVSPRDASPAAPAAAPAPTDLGYEGKMQGIIDSGAGQADPNSPFRANEIVMLAGGFDDIAKNLAKGTLAGDSTAMDNVNSLVILFPEHRDIIASYALAEEENSGTDPKTYLDQVQQRNPETPAATTSAPAPVSSGAGPSDTLQSLLDVVGGDIAKGERVSQVNRDIGQVLRHLKGVAGDDGLLKSEAASTIDYLNNNGLTEHAAIISGYANDPSKSAFKDARSSIREVSAVNAPVVLTAAEEAANREWDKTASGGDPDVSVTLDQAVDSVNSRLEAAGFAPSSDLREQLIQAQPGTNQGATSSPLGIMLNKIDSDVQGNASTSQINRDVGQVLRYLKTISINTDLLQSESTRAVDFLNDKGLTKHAEIISDYANDPSKASFKDARSAIREVAENNVNSAAFGEIASNADSIEAQIEEFKMELAAVGGMDVIPDSSPDISLASMKA